MVRGSTPGKPLKFKIERDGKPLDVSITPKSVDGVTRVGIVPGPGFTFPFDVHVNIDPDIGGPSAGLMFSLAIYDTLTPGLAHRRRGRGRHRHHPGRRQRRADRRDPAEDRVGPRRRRPALPGPARQLRGRARRPQRGHAAGPRRHHARRRGGHRGLGEGPRRHASRRARPPPTRPQERADDGPRPRPRGRRPRDRVALRRRRVGPAGPPLRAGRHRSGWSPTSPRWPRPWAWTTPRPRAR